MVSLDVGAKAGDVGPQPRLDGLEPGLPRIAVRVHPAQLEEVVLDLVERQRVEVALGLAPVGELSRLQRDQLD